MQMILKVLILTDTQMKRRNDNRRNVKNDKGSRK